MSISNDIIAPITKRRKTTSDKRHSFLNDKHLPFDLNKNDDHIFSELDKNSNELEIIFNTSKKRKYRELNSKAMEFISYIPKPHRNTIIRLSKYQNFKSLLPSVNLT